MNAAAVTIIIVIGAIAVIQTADIFMNIQGFGCPYGVTAVIVLDKNDDVEFKIDNVLHKLRWSDDELVKRIVLINNGLSYTQLEKCRACCKNNNMLELTDPENAAELIISGEKIM